MQQSPTSRQAQRLQTRERVLDAAIVEFQRAGTSAADINAIVDAAGVARSTFYFHFPTKEHVLRELIGRDEGRLAEELSRFLDTPHDLAGVLQTIVELVLTLESRWGTSLFRDVISVYFSPSRVEDEQWTRHPTFMLLAAEIERSRNRGELYDDVDAFYSAGFFLAGIYAALLTTAREESSERHDVLKMFVRHSLRSLQRVSEIP